MPVSTLPGHTTTPPPASEVFDPSLDLDLDLVLAQAVALVARAQTRALALSLDTFGDIELPPTAPVTEDDQALLRSIAPLYLAAQLESARLVPAVELLSGLAISGGLRVELGPGAGLIASFWRQRN